MIQHLFTSGDVLIQIGAVWLLANILTIVVCPTYVSAEF